MAQSIVIGIEPGTAERVAWAGGELARGLGARVGLARCPVTVVPHGAAPEIGAGDEWD